MWGTSDGSPRVSAGAPLSVLVLFFCCVMVPLPTHAYIYAHYSNMTSMLFEDLPALFGSPLPKDGIMVLNAQLAGYSAVIVHNLYSDTLLNMNYSNETMADAIDIPSVFTSYYASQILRNFIIPEQGAYVILKPEFAFPLSYYLIPFTGVVGMIILVMCVVLIIRCVQYRKRMRKNRLSKEQLKKIPIHKFTKGDDYDLCAICLDDYEEGDKLRVLPCSHAYHCKCVDPWLTQTKKTCPVCKQRVTHSPTEHSESESEEETGSREEEGTEGEADSERTPLLRPSNPGSPSGSPGVYSATTTTTTPSASSPLPTATPPSWCTRATTPPWRTRIQRVRTQRRTSTTLRTTPPGSSTGTQWRSEGLCALTSYFKDSL
ncbi:hypothetical protein F7725_006561, partial [Dissostichus mawsoni]